MQSRCLLPLALLLSVFVTSPALFAQNQPPQSDPQAVSMAQQAIAALTNGVTVEDVTLNGNFTWIAGSDDEKGPATLLAKGTGESRIDLHLSGGIRTEIRNDSSGSPQGETLAPDGSTEQWAKHNCWINASWFFPALSLLASTGDPSVIFTYVGLENRGNNTVQHIRAYRYQANRLSAVIATLSTEDIYLDSTSFLPVAFAFNSHPEDDQAANIYEEIDFSNYQFTAGVQVPIRVQRLINGGLALDVTVSNVALNTGISDGLFAIQ